MAEAASTAEVEAGRGYERLFVPAVFSAWTRHLVDAARLSGGQDVLDLACGTGVVARHAREVVGHGGRVVGVDPAPGMIAAAAEVEPGITWVQGPAEALPLDAHAFDAVLCQFGAMFFSDRAAALAEIRRVLKPGGRLALAVWDDIARNPAYGRVAALLDDLVSEAAGDCIRIPFSLGDRGALRAELSDAGFSRVSVTTETESARFPSPRLMVEVELRGWLPLFGITLDEAQIDAVLAQAEPHLAEFTTEDGAAAFPTTAHVLSAISP